MEIMGDGWYRLKGDAKEALERAEDRGGMPIGLVETKYGSWGLLYWGEPKDHPDSHTMNDRSAFVGIISTPKRK